MLKPVCTLTVCSAILFVPTALLAQETAQQAPVTKVDEFHLKRVQIDDPNCQDPTNAALLYYGAWQCLAEDTFHKVNEAVSCEDNGWTPAASLVQRLRESSVAIAMLLRAAAAPKVDWGIEYSRGTYMLLPQVGRLRSTARLFAADARRAVLDKAPDDAAERVAAMFAVSKQCAETPVLICSLVSMAIDHMALLQVDYLITSGVLTEVGTKRILEKMAELPAADPFGFRASLRGEQMMTNAVWRGCHGPEGAAVFAEQVIAGLASAEGADPDLDRIRAMDRATQLAELDKANRYYAEAQSALDAPDVLGRCEQLDRDVADGKYGLIGSHTLPKNLAKNYTSYRQHVWRHEEMLAKLRGVQPAH